MRKIDQIRDGAKVFEVSDEEDKSPIRFMFGTPQGFYTVKDNSIFVTQLADKIDPERKNIDVPDVHQRALSYGFTNRVVGKILVTAEQLFKSNMFLSVIEYEEVMGICLRATQALCNMQDQANKITGFIKPILETGVRFDASKGQILPRTPELEQSIDLFIRNSDALRQTMIDFTKAFYKVEGKKDVMARLEAEIIQRHGVDHLIVGYFPRLRSIIDYLRDLRNGLEHPGPDHTVILKDFSVRVDGQFHAPTIELVSTKTPQSEMGVVEFLEQNIMALTNEFEIMMGNLCASNVPDFGGFECGVMELPEDRRRHAEARLGLAILMPNGWQPLG